MYIMKLIGIYTLSFWLYIIAILFSLDIIDYSPLLLWIFAFPFFLQVVIVRYDKTPFLKKLFFIVWEFMFLLMVLLKTTKLNVGFNYGIFIVYLIFISINNQPLCKIYNEELPKIFNNKDNIFDNLLKLLY